MKKPWFISVVISLCAGLMLGALVMWAAWLHNPQCEIHCAEQGIDWAYWLLLGAGGVLLGFFACLPLTGMLMWLLRKT